MNKTGIIILAAGSSSRMGRSKQLLPWKESTLLEHVVKTALECDAMRVIVVLGANEQIHRKAVQHLPVEVVVNENWERGMGASLKKGLKHLIQISAESDGILVMVSDQPLVTSNHLRALMEAGTASGKRIIASGYAATSGVPTFFSSTLFEDLLKMDDSSGAKKIIQQQNPADITMIDFPAGAADIDTPEDYEVVRKKT